MPFFGQVWLWSLAGFLVGALLCWALVALPARRRAAELADRLAEARRAEPAPSPYQSRLDVSYDDYADQSPVFGRAEDSPEDLTAPPEAVPEPEEPPAVAPVESTRMLSVPPVAPHAPVEAPPEVEPEWLPVAERFDVSRLDASDSPEDEHLVDDLPDETGTIFTQHTTPISGSLISRIDDDSSLVDDLDGDDDIDPHRGHFAAALTPDDEEEYLREHPPTTDPDEPVTRFLPAVEAEPAAEDSPAEPELPKRDALPKRTPGAGSRRAPVGEFTPAEPERSRHSLEPEESRSRHEAAEPALFTPAQPEPEPSVFAPSVPEPEPTMFAPAVREPEPTVFAPSVPEPEPTMFAPAVREPELFAPADREPELFAPAAPERPEPEPTVFAPSVPEPVEEPAAAAPVSPAGLPKRVPKKPGDRFPFGVRTGAPEPAATPSASSAPAAAQTSQAVAEAEPERSRSLFEPVRPADEAPAAKAPAPATTRMRRGGRPSQVLPGGVDTFVPPGPFGPGSAMPLPGGNSPSSEYRVKASVTALRYCSPESPKFDRTVAEVWFRTVADAERVGFRPLP